MADLSPEDRGQVILVAAFLLAAIFVSLTLVVNSAIFTENLATRGETSGASEALTLRAVAEENAGDLLTHVNRHNNTFESAQVHNLSAGITNLSEALARQHAIDGAVVTLGPVDPDAVVNGTRVVDRSPGGSTFEGDSGADNWTVAANLGTGDTRAFVLNVSHGSVVDGVDDFGGTRADEFYVNVTDGTDTWRVNLTDRSGTFTVGVLAPSGAEARCQVDGSPASVRVDLTRGLVAGEPCPPLRFARGVGSGYDVTYNNSDLVSGNYSVVFEPNPPTTRDLASGPGTTSPYATDAVYAVTLRYRYDGPTTVYATDVRVAPGEPS